MKYDQYGRAWTDCDELFSMLYSDPDLKLDRFFVHDQLSTTQYNESISRLWADFPKLQMLAPGTVPVEEFHAQQQSNWHMPDSYKKLDIAAWVLDQCKTDPELQRVGEELLLFQERDLFDLLRYLKYIVDTFRSNNIVWGLGRGSSVASYVLYIIGIHKINSMFYDLDIKEFLK